MADGIKIGPIQGAAELAQFFALAHDEAVLIAAKKGTQAAAARGKTLLARRAPKGLKSTTRIKNGWPRLSEVFRSKGGKVAPISWYGVISRGPYYYNVLDQGRAPYSKNGKPVAGTDPMRPWFNAAVQSMAGEVIARLVQATTRNLFRECARVIAKTGAPVQIKGGGGGTIGE
jgi:hypothetical protein